MTQEHKNKISLAMKGIKRSKKTRRKIGLKSGGRNVGVKSHFWKGGRPKCLDCNILLSSYEAKRCLKCYGKAKVGPNNPRWKGGYENTVYLNHKRKLLKKNVLGTHTLEEWLALKIKYQFMCLCCKQVEPEIQLTEDHIIPISKGGTDDISNIQPLCRSCNSSKFTKIISFLTETKPVRELAEEAPLK